MNIGFIETYDIESPEYDQIDLYNPLLPKLCFCYVKNYFDGFLYAYKDRNIGFDDLLQFFIKAKSLALKLNFGQIRLNKKMDSCVCLLVNPYFDEFCRYIESNIHTINKSKLTFLKKHVFKVLADDTNNRQINDYDFGIKQFYQEHNCYERSKKMLELFHEVYQKT
jgi:hypothetical protein